MKALSVVFFGNINNYPFLLAEGFRALGHKVKFILNRKELLHRPEARFSEWRSGYPDWIIDFSSISDDDIARDDPKVLSPLIRELRADADLVILNDFGHALAKYLTCPHVSLVTGSDLTSYANFDMLTCVSRDWDSNYRRSVEGRSFMARWTRFIASQRDGLLTAEFLITFGRGVIADIDRQLDSIGIGDERRLVGLLANTLGLQNAPFGKSKKMAILNGARILFRRESHPGMCDLDIKGTDILLKGFAAYCKNGGNGELRLVRKGQDVDAACELIDQLGISERVVWLNEMPLAEYYDAVRKSDLVCDQLATSSPGMVTMDAYALGRPVMANLRNDFYSENFPEPLPGFHAENPSDIADCLMLLEKDRGLLAAMGRSCRSYAEKYLAPEQMVRRILSRLEACSGFKDSGVYADAHVAAEKAGLVPQPGVVSQSSSLSKQWLSDEQFIRLRQNPRLFRIFICSLDVLDRIPGLASGRNAFNSIRKHGMRWFIQNSFVPRVQRFLERKRLSMALGLDMSAPFNVNWPSEKSLIPARSISSFAKSGKFSVCLVTANMSAGGAERQVVSLACELKKRGHEVRVRVMNLNGENAHYLPYLKEHGVDIAVPQLPGISDILFMKRLGVDLSLLKHLPAELRLDALALTLDLLRNPVDVAHCYLDWCCCYGGFAALLSGTPCVRFSWRNVNPTHFEFYRDWMPKLYGFFLSFQRIKVENNTSSGAADYAAWLGLSLGSVEVVPNGISSALFRSSILNGDVALRQSIGIAPKAPLVVSIGRLSAEKRPFDLAEVLLSLRQELPSGRFVHVGTGPLKNALQERLASMGLADAFAHGSIEAPMLLLDRREDVFDVLKASDVFLLTSGHEGMPNVIMEAMFAGLPVVATRVGGVPDLIQDGVHGFLHDVGDTKGMARSLARLLTNPALRQRMGNAGRDRIVSDFTVERLADRVTNTYAAHCFAAGDRGPE